MQSATDADADAAVADAWCSLCLRFYKETSAELLTDSGLSFPANTLHYYLDLNFETVSKSRIVWTLAQTQNQTELNEQYTQLDTISSLNCNF